MEREKRQNFTQSYQRNLIHATVASTTGINNKTRLIKAYGSQANRIEVLNKLKKQSKFTLWWFSTFILLGLVCLVLDFENSWFNVFDLFFVMVNVYLIAKGKLIGIYIGIAECFVYAFICYQSQLFGEVVKSLLISVPLNIYSVIVWKQGIKERQKEKYNQKEDEDVVIKKMTKTQKVLCGFSVVFVSVACYFFLKYVLGQTTALYLSSLSLAIIIVGKVLTAKQFMETYAVFNLSDIIGVGMWIETMISIGFNIPAMSMLIYYLALLFNDVYAFNLWKAMYRKVAINHGGYLFARRKIKINKIIKLRRQYQKLKWNRAIDVSKNS